ncbi:hypothetical protein ACSBL2_03210 [Pedobacter sp. AW31-3R]|uniref:hypothetical protein n=1 Tax=Pedobacter sp. AW31-3R TaxID=3445781 RepID=UPI003FA0D33F
MKKFTFSLKIGVFISLCVISLSFSADPAADELGEIQQKLTDHYDLISGQIKRYELNMTSNGFCRYKRFFNNGKIEYFSFNLLKFKNIDYLGNTGNGILFMRTRGEDVIVQTYNDKRGGDIDSMATYLTIPLKNMEAEDLNELELKIQKMSLALRR